MAIVADQYDQRCIYKRALRFVVGLMFVNKTHSSYRKTSTLHQDPFQNHCTSEQKPDQQTTSQTTSITMRFSSSALLMTAAALVGTSTANPTPRIAQVDLQFWPNADCSGDIYDTWQLRKDQCFDPEFDSSSFFASVTVVATYGEPELLTMHTQSNCTCSPGTNCGTYLYHGDELVQGACISFSENTEWRSASLSDE
jgi:hypothetical protein